MFSSWKKEQFEGKENGLRIVITPTLYRAPTMSSCLTFTNPISFQLVALPGRRDCYSPSQMRTQGPRGDMPHSRSHNQKVMNSELKSKSV